MRILIVTHAPLTTEFGASQIAANLGEALRAQGQLVTLWSPQPLDPNTRWWRTIRAMRTRLDDFLKIQEPFDVIDCPVTLITRLASRSATVVARSTQPELLYLWTDLKRRRERRPRSLLRFPFECAHTFYHMSLVLLGWIRADRIMCLGSLELRWMKRWFPWWRGKLASYFVAPSERDQKELAIVRRARQPWKVDQIRFLWIGRWEAHKGTNVLLDFIAQWSVQRPQDTFTIAGCGAEVKRHCPSALLQSGTLSVIPSFNREELYSLLAEHDIGLFTSKVEGWGLSLNEMLESGMMIFATPAGGVSDLRPYFEKLFEFPPTLVSIMSKPIREPVKNYYDTYNWPHIAMTYTSEFPGSDPKSLERTHETLAQHSEAPT